MIGSDPTSRRQWTIRLAAIAGLLFVTLIAYSPAITAKYIWDDDAWITKNVRLRSLEGLWQIWTDPTGADIVEYYPLTLTNFWLDYQLWGLEPMGYHLVNILMHVADAVLIAVLLSRLKIPGAWLAAAVFALHPVNVESVAWAVERKNTLSMLMALLSLLMFVKSGALEESEPIRRGKIAWSIVFYVLAVLSKTVLITLPAVMIVLIWWKTGRLRVRKVALALPYLAIGLPLGAFAVWMQHHNTGATGPEFEMSPMHRVLIAGRAPWFYLGKLAWPSPLVFAYPKWAIDPSSMVQYAWPISVLALVAVLLALRNRIGRGPLAAVLIFGGMLSPALGFFNIYWHRYMYVADHVQYHAAVAMFALFAAGATIASRRLLPVVVTSKTEPKRRGSAAIISSESHPSPLAIAPAAVLLLVLAVLTWRQSLLYEDNEPLLRDVIAHNPTSTLAHENLAHTLAEKGRLEEAVAEFRIALQVAAPLPERQSKAQYNLAVTLERTGQTQEAEQLYRMAMATSTDPKYVSPWYNLANMLLARKSYQEAIALYEEVVRRDPLHADARNNFGSTFLSLGQPAAAVSQFEEVTRLHPNVARNYANLGYALLAANRPADAAASYQKALSLDPATPGARAGLQRANEAVGR